MYIVVCKSRASAIFYPGDSYSINYALPDGQKIVMTFKTSYDESKGFKAPLPKDLWVEAKGPAENLHHAADLFGNGVLDIAAILAVAANASMGTPLPELVFDASSEKEEHEFLQIFTPDRPVTAVPGRRIDVELVHALLVSLANHPERPRIQRAMGQYVEALETWRPGREISCLAHLWMGIEAITDAILRTHLAGREEKELMAQWGAADGKQLRSEVRRRLVFQEDTASFKKARTASDGFEHGFSDFDTIRKPAREVLLKTAEYLRVAIIDLLNIDSNLRTRALGADYATPRGPLNVVRYMFGNLIGKADQLAASDQSYPIMEWKTTLKEVLIGDDGKFGFKGEENLTAKLGPSVKFRPSRAEIWDGSTIHEQTPPPTGKQ